MMRSSRGFCPMHYERSRTGKDLLAPHKPRRHPKSAGTEMHCRICGLTKPICDFYPHPRNYKRSCISCAKQRLRDARYSMAGKATTLYHSSRARARQYGVTHDITKGWVAEQLQKGHCALTGLPFFYGQNDTLATAHPMSPSIDRIQPGGSYTMQNCRMVVTAVNVALNDWGEDTFSQIATAYVLKNQHGVVP